MKAQIKQSTIAIFPETINKIDQLKAVYKKEFNLTTLHRKQLVERLVNEAYEIRIGKGGIGDAEFNEESCNGSE